MCLCECVYILHLHILQIWYLITKLNMQCFTYCAVFVDFKAMFAFQFTLHSWKVGKMLFWKSFIQLNSRVLEMNSTFNCTKPGSVALCCIESFDNCTMSQTLLQSRGPMRGFTEDSELFLQEIWVSGLLSSLTGVLHSLWRTTELLWTEQEVRK